MNGLENRAISYLPKRIAKAVEEKSSLWNREISEIRLRENRLLSLTVRGRNIPCDVVCTREEIGQTVMNLCSGSLYSHTDEIRSGVITTECGIRAGVAGRAVMVDGRVAYIRDICSINIRIPRRVPRAADELYELCRDGRSVLVYAPPGVGKTTVLRELIPLLAGGENPCRVAVIDTRYELCAGVESTDLCDVFFGYPRSDGIESAVRTMSPEFIICDEISDRLDVEAVRYAASSGVCVCATTHASSIEDIRNSPTLGALLRDGVFHYLYGLSRGGRARVDGL